MPATHQRLYINIDHVATLRQARRAREPDPVEAARACEDAGADGITAHLREDRRHIQDHDVQRIKATCRVRLNLEMAATEEMVEIARRVRPQMCTLVPEGRMEVTTEGGLDVAGQLARMKNVVKKLHEAGIGTSAFIDAVPRQVKAAAAAGFGLCEVHTGPYAHAFHAHGHDLKCKAVAGELRKVTDAGKLIGKLGMEFNAGHALNYNNVRPIAVLPGLHELHIGHAIVSRAIFVGLRAAVREMKELIQQANPA